MKKILIFLLVAVCLVSLLATPASASELYVNAIFNVVGGSSSSYNFVYNFTNNQWLDFKATASSDVELTLILSNDEFNDTDPYAISMFFMLDEMSNRNLIYPSSVIINEGLSSEEELEIFEDEPAEWRTFTITNFCSVSPSPGLGTFYDKVVGMDIVLYPGGGVQSLKFIYQGSDFITSSASSIFGVFPLSVQYLGATSKDVVDSLNAVRQATASSGSAVAAAVNQTSNAVQSAIQSSQNATTQTLNELKSAVVALQENQKEATKSAISEFFDELKQNTVNEFNNTVEDLKDQLPVDPEVLNDSFNQLYTSVSTHDSSPVVQFPAGKVSLLGQEFVFWEAQNIEFNQYFNMPGIQLLLAPLRFVFLFGMAKYLLWWFGELEKLITLHTTGGASE